MKSKQTLNVIVADIFGHTAALEALAQSLSQPYRILCPYSKATCDNSCYAPAFKDEAAAYHCFTQTVGLEQYVKHIHTEIALIDQPINIIAFSVGASASWILAHQLADDLLSNIQQIQCFYPGQIRHYLSLQPKIPIDLIFPLKELHFDVQQVIDQLLNKPNVKIEHCDYMHGFMNALSINYSDTGYQCYLERLNKTG